MTTPLPSGVHTIADAGVPGGWLIGIVHVPDVRRFGSPLVADTVHRCVGGSASVIVKFVLSVTSKERFHFSKPGPFSGSSCVANAMVFESGDHASCCAPRGLVVSCFGAPPPLDGTTNTCSFCAPAGPAFARNANFVPSGDHRSKFNPVSPFTIVVDFFVAMSTTFSSGS